MIDDGQAGAWASALLPTHPSLRILTDGELHSPDLIAKVQRDYACETMGEARDIIAAEKMRRTTSTDFPRG